MTRTQMVVRIMNEYFELVEKEREQLNSIFGKKQELKEYLSDEGIKFNKFGLPILDFIEKKKE